MAHEFSHNRPGINNQNKKIDCSRLKESFQGMIDKTAADLHHVSKRRRRSSTPVNRLDSDTRLESTDVEESEFLPKDPPMIEACNKDTENIGSESVHYYFAIVDAKSFGKFLIPTYKYNQIVDGLANSHTESSDGPVAADSDALS